MWEYHVEAMMMDELQPETMESRLNELGDARWDLVSMAPRGINYVVMIFKREKRLT